jgi:hypothetical protein
MYKSIVSQLAGNCFSPIKQPKCCSRLIKHGFYTRYCEDTKSRIGIQRFICTGCRKTWSILPEGLVAYFQSSLGLIYRTLHHRFQHAKWPDYTKRQRAGYWLSRLLRYCRVRSLDQKAEDLLRIAFDRKANFLE